MSGVLDQEELDALMDGAEAAREGTGKYDLARQDYALQRLLPALNDINEQFASTSRDTLRSLLPTLESISIDSTTVLRFDELERRLESPCSLGLFQGLPDGAGLLLAVESELVSQMVDRYFGGFGGVSSSREKFSVSEESFAEQFQDALTADIEAAWKPLLNQAFSLVYRGGDTRKLEAYSDSDSVVACRFVVSFGGESDLGFWVAVPWSALEGLRDQIEEPKSKREGNADVEWQQKLVKRLEIAPVELTASLMDSVVSLKRVVNFKVGEVIEIVSAEDIVLSLDGRDLIKGRLGSLDGNFAVRIDGYCEPEEE